MHVRLYGCVHYGRSRGTANPQLAAAVMHLRFIVNVQSEQLIRNELQMHLRFYGCTHCDVYTERLIHNWLQLCAYLHMWCIRIYVMKLSWQSLLGGVLEFWAA